MCKELAVDDSAYCEKHKPKEDKPFGGIEHKYDFMYQCNRWRVLRKKILQAHPFCSLCKNEATEVHHKIAHRGDINTFYDEGNLQALCKSCHSRFTSREIADRKKGEKYATMVVHKDFNKVKPKRVR